MANPDPAVPHFAPHPALRPAVAPVLSTLAPQPGEHRFEARLARPCHAPEPLPAPALPQGTQSARHAYRSLASAACYLATRRTGDLLAAAEAATLLRRLAGEIAAEGLQPVSHPEQAGVWAGQASRWERQSFIEGALCFVRASSEARKITVRPKRRSRWGRWLSAWQGTPGMQTF